MKVWGPTEEFGVWSEVRPSAVLVEPARHTLFQDGREEWLLPVHIRRKDAYRWPPREIEIRDEELGWRRAEISVPQVPVANLGGVEIGSEVRYLSLPLKPAGVQLTLQSRHGTHAVVVRIDHSLASPPQGAPLRESVVTIAPRAGGEKHPVTAILVASYVRPDGEDPEPVQTSEDGTFRVLTEMPEYGWKVSGSYAWLALMAPGYGLTPVAVRSLQQDVALQPAVRVVGRILDQLGKPIGGLRIGVARFAEASGEHVSNGGFGPPTSFRFPDRLRSSYSTVTAPDGTYSIDGLTPRATIALGSSNPLIVESRLKDFPLTGERVNVLPDLYFRWGGEIAGRVVRDGKPLARVSVAGSRDGYFFWTTTDEKGAFRVERLETGRYDVSVMTAVPPYHSMVPVVTQKRVEVRAKRVTRGITIKVPAGMIVRDRPEGPDD